MFNKSKFIKIIESRKLNMKYFTTFSVLFYLKNVKNQLILAIIYLISIFVYTIFTRLEKDFIDFLLILSLGSMHDSNDILIIKKV